MSALHTREAAGLVIVLAGILLVLVVRRKTQQAWREYEQWVNHVRALKEGTRADDGR
jgi:hypothetical protein